MSGWSPEAFGMVVVLIIGAIATAAVKIIGALKSVETKVGDLEVKVDGRLTELLTRTQKLAHAEGIEAGRGEAIVSIVPPATLQVLPGPAAGEKPREVGSFQETTG